MKRLLAFLFPRSQRIAILELTVEKGFLIMLDSLAKRSECLRAEVIDRSVQLYAEVLAQAEQGKVPVFLFPD